MHCVIGYENFEDKKWYYIEVPDLVDEPWKSMSLEIHNRITMIRLSDKSKVESVQT